MASSMKKTVSPGGSSTTVYSTDPSHPTRCRQCLRLVTDCVCGRDAPKNSDVGDGIIRLSRETKGRKGAGVTLVTGLPLTGAALDALASRLKKLCGVGGTVREGVIEIQGEQRERLRPELEKLGYSVKIAGG
jgi:translation initiation factor 1